MTYHLEVGTYHIWLHYLFQSIHVKCHMIHKSVFTIWKTVPGYLGNQFVKFWFQRLTQAAIYFSNVFS